MGLRKEEEEVNEEEEEVAYIRRKSSGVAEYQFITTRCSPAVTRSRKF